MHPVLKDSNVTDGGDGVAARWTQLMKMPDDAISENGLPGALSAVSHLRIEDEEIPASIQISTAPLPQRPRAPTMSTRGGSLECWLETAEERAVLTVESVPADEPKLA